jgi:hypothetical protein
VPETAPVVRVDNESMLKTERDLFRALVEHAADFVNAIGRGGVIYPMIALPPEEAAAKKAAMERQAMNRGQ